jgi:hypothetical protein
MPDPEFEYGDILEVVEGPHKGEWGYYDNDEATDDEEDCVVLLLHVTGGVEATEALIEGNDIVVPTRFCRLKMKQ